MKKKLFAILLCLAMLLTFLPVAALAATTIGSEDLLITQPVQSETPDSFVEVVSRTCRVDTSCNSDGYKNGIRWKNVATGKTMSDSDTFTGGRKYEFSVCLFANSGYAFSASATKVTINMDKASLSVQDVNHARATITLTAEKAYIKEVTVSGLTAPKADSTPDYSVTVDDSCRVTNLVWTDETSIKTMDADTKFQDGHKYALSLVVSAKSGYVFSKNVKVNISGEWITPNSISETSIVFGVDYPTLSSHTHTPSEWRTTQVYHYRVCTTCGEMLPEEDHKGGKATCGEMGKCTVCGYAYIEKTEKHSPEKKWTACGQKYHAHLCKVCGAHCSPQDHKPGPEATETEPQKCTVCNFVITPAKSHDHSLTAVPEVAATCVQPGVKAHYTCSECSLKFLDAEGKEAVEQEDALVLAPLGHKTSDNWEANDENHWRICTACKEKISETEMKHEMKDDKCTTCGYGTEQPQKGLPWWGLLLIGLGAVVIGAGGSVLVMKLARKKECDGV